MKRRSCAPLHLLSLVMALAGLALMRDGLPTIASALWAAIHTPIPLGLAAVFFIWPWVAARLAGAAFLGIALAACAHTGGTILLAGAMVALLTAATHPLWATPATPS